MPLSDTVERIESLKAGGISSGTAAIAALLFGWAHRQIAFPGLAGSEVGFSYPVMSLLPIVVAGFTGFLFGVTYRYVIRQDTNPHLKSGAVMAFGLTRSLAQIETAIEPNFLAMCLPLLIAGLESIGMIAIAALILERAMRQGWIKPFGQPANLNLVSEEKVLLQEPLDVQS
jgi:hypothetical protein